MENIIKRHSTDKYTRIATEKVRKNIEPKKKKECVERERIKELNICYM